MMHEVGEHIQLPEAIKRITQLPSYKGKQVSRRETVAVNETDEEKAPRFCSHFPSLEEKMRDIWIGFARF